MDKFSCSDMIVVDMDLARRIGLDEAVVCSVIRNGCRGGNGNTMKEGHYWVRESIGVLAREFPFWSKGKIRKLIKAMVERGYLVQGNYNESQWDRTKWYRVKE